jgi:hypothetical protein
MKETTVSVSEEFAERAEVTKKRKIIGYNIIIKKAIS